MVKMKAKRKRARKLLLSYIEHRPAELINLIINCGYWEIIAVQTIIVMSIIYILSKEIPSETRLCKSIWYGPNTMSKQSQAKV